MQFIEVTGQKKLKERLISMVKENKLPHAMLFYESPGFGAFALALSLASFMLCDNPTQTDSCGVCASCNKSKKLIHPDLHFVMPVNNTKRVPSDKKPVSDHFIDEWRKMVINSPYFYEQQWYDEIKIENKSGNISVNEASLIINKLNLRSFMGKEKFVIIWLPEKLSTEASNKLLKLIEEPPAGTYFILVSSSPERILTTILSRCQLIMVPPITHQEIIAELSQQTDLSSDELNYYAKLSGGSLTKVRELLEERHKVVEYEEYLQLLLDSSLSKDLTRSIEFWEEVSQLNREELRGFLEYTLSFIRSAFMMAQGIPELAYMPPSKEKMALYWSQKFKPQFYTKAYSIINDLLADLNRNVNAKYLFADMGNRFFVSL